MEFAGARVWVLIGPTPADAGSYYAVLSRIAEGGPANRVGLQPQRDRRDWRFDPRLSPSVVAGDIDLDPTDVDGTMTQLARRTVDQPILAGNIGGHLALCIDHGIGDAHAIAEIAAALTRPGEPLPAGYLPPQQDLNVTRPLSRVAYRMLAAGPAGIARDVAHELNAGRARRAATEAAGQAERVSAADSTSGYSTIFIRSQPGFLPAVRELRDGRYRGTSVATLVFYALRRSLSQCLEDGGARLAPTTGLLTDLRRYLREGEATLANLSTVAQAVTPRGQTLAEFGASVSRAAGANSSYPATRTLAVCALRALRPQAPAPGSGVAEAHIGNIEVTFSDVSRLPSLRKFQYRSDSSDRITAVALPPGARNQLTIALVTVGHELQLTATYFPDVIPAEPLREALKRGLTFDVLAAV
ncbi:hypothetical protein ACRCUN_03210 [Mycobacterium sp. LTG2003]